jgi:uncharacterized protein YbjT (DUF2867 family)
MKILILGANGQIARVVTKLVLERTSAQLTLYLRNASRLKSFPNDRVKVIEGNVLDREQLQAAMEGHDTVYANLSGKMEEMAVNIVQAMHATGIKKIVFVSSMGIYGEVPGKQYGEVLEPYRQSADVIEASDLDYTIIRPAWLNDKDEIAYGTTQKDETFKNGNQTVSRKSVADLIVNIATNSELESRKSLGVHYEI